jgi:hypothetical protein
MTQETHRLTIDFSRANTLRELILIHCSAQRKHCLWDVLGALNRTSDQKRLRLSHM